MNDDYSFYTNNALTSRRRFMQGTSSLMALGSLPGYLSANTNALHDTLGELQQQHGVVFYRPDEAHSVAFADTLSQFGLVTVALTDDPVRQWRGEAGILASKAGNPVLGLTSWMDYLLISGLAAGESPGKRKYVQMELQHAIVQPGNRNWSAHLALAHLQLPKQAGREQMQAHIEAMLENTAVEPGTPSLFSWMLG